MDVRATKKKRLLGCVVSGPGSETKPYDSKKNLDYLKWRFRLEDELGAKDWKWSWRCSESACSASGPQAGSHRIKSQQSEGSAPEEASAEASSTTGGSLRRKKTSGEEERRKFRIDGEVVLEADFREASDHLTSSPKLQKGAQNREKEAIALSPNRRAICVLKGDPDYNIALEDLEDSQDEWIYEVEGLFQEVHAEDRLIYMKGRIFKEIGTAEPWRCEVPHPPLLLLSGGAKTGSTGP
ncbi:uncharacterized protein LOC131423532 [Marmota monax]|nr:uncharacterized protein LOC131423532 [Marmota monax]